MLVSFARGEQPLSNYHRFKGVVMKSLLKKTAIVGGLLGLNFAIGAADRPAAAAQTGYQICVTVNGGGGAGRLSIPFGFTLGLRATSTG